LQNNIKEEASHGQEDKFLRHNSEGEGHQGERKDQARPKGSYKAEADILTRQEEPIDKVNTEKRLRS